MKLLILANPRLIHARRWINWFAGRGHEILVATCEPERDAVVGAPQQRIISLPGQRVAQYILAAPSVARILRQFKPEVVNAHFLPGYPFSAALAGACPLVVSTWGSDVLLNARRSIFHRWRAGYTLSRSSLVTCDGDVLLQRLLQVGVPEEKIINAPMGIEPELFHRVGRGERDSAMPPLIVSTRRLEKLYGQATLLSAAAILNRQGQGFRLTVAGDGSYERRLRAIVRQERLEAFVEFRGALAHKNLPALLRAADIYVSASSSDSTSVSLLEAMACGAFPVVSDIPGNREWIEHGVNGLLFPHDNARALADCLLRAMQENNLRNGAAGINERIIFERAQWNGNMARVEEAFKVLL